MSKAADAFRTISEVADELDVPKHVLRFWENRFPQIKPMKRGGGRRYYRPTDLELLKGIRHLLHNEGYTIKGVQKILREQGVDVVKSSIEAPLTPMSRTSMSARAAAKAPAAAGPIASKAKTKLGAGGRGQRAPSLPTDRKAAIAMLIRELEAARELLMGQVAAAARPKAQARARR